MTDWRRDISRALLTMRVAGICAVGIAAVALPAVGPSRFAVGAVLLAGYAPLVALIERFVPVIRRDLAHAGADVAAAVTLAHLAPVWTSALVVATVSVVASIAALSRRELASLSIALVLGMASAGIVGGVDAWYAPLLVFALVMAPVTRYGEWQLERERSTTERLDDLMSSANAIFWELDEDTTRIRTVLGRVHELTGHDPDEVSGMELGSVLRPDDAAAFTTRIADLATHNRDEVISAQGRLAHADGSWRWFRHLARVQPQRTGVVVRGVSFDVTELEQARRALTQYQDIVDGLQSAVIVAGRATGRPGAATSGPTVVVRANPACVATLGLEPEQLIGRPLDKVVAGVDLELVVSRLLDTGVGDAAVPLEVRPSSGPADVLEVAAVALPGDLVALLISDVSRRAEGERTIRHQAVHDGLTGLHNRTHFVEQLALRCGATDPFALLLMDLDRFKEVNDTLGHQFGDELLQELARRVRAQCRDDDVVARLGGDEFAVLASVASFGAAVDLARRLASACSEPVSVQDLRVAVKASVGVVLAPLHGSDRKTLLRRADLAMYSAKRSATSVRMFESERERDDSARLALLGEIPRAVDEGEFQLWLQPKLDLGSLEVVGAEGLLRWHHPELGVLTPGAFLDLIDVSGQMERVTQLVLNQGAEHAARLRRLGHEVPVAINLAARSLCDDALPAMVAETLARHALPPEMVVLEITETDVMDELPSTRHVLDRLGAMGIRLGIDDFGTGYSSLTRLRQLPVSKIKVDRSFVMDLVAEGSDAVIVRSIIDLAHNLGLRAVAEGVEREEVHHLLQQWGCDSAQGHLYGWPCHVDEFERELTTDRWRGWRAAATATTGRQRTTTT